MVWTPKCPKNPYHFINIITKKPSYKPFQADVSAGYNGSANGTSGSATISGSVNDWQYRLSGGYENNDELKTPMGKAYNTYFDSKTLAGALSYNINPDTTIGATLDYYKLKFGSGDYGTPGFAVDIPKWERTKGALFGEVRNVNEYLTKLRIDAFYQHSDKVMINTVPAGPMKVVPGANNKLDQYGFSVQSDWQINAGNFLIVGYEFDYDKLNANSTTKMIRPTATTVMADRTYNGHQMSNALFASMESTLPADFSLNYGVRYTHYETQMHIADNKTPANSAQQPDGSNGKAVFNAGLTWSGIENFSARATYAQGYRSPLLQELYVDTSMGSAHSVALANPNLKPETSQNFELGARWMPGTVMIDGSLFFNKADNYIDIAYINPHQYQYQNVAKAKTFGLELQTSAKLSETGLEPYATLTWMRRQFNDGDFKTYDTATPSFFARYGVRWSGTVQDVKLHTDAYARSSTATNYKTKGAKNDYRLGGATTLNLTAGATFGSQDAYSFDMGFYNINNKAYRTQLSIFEPERYFAAKFNASF